MTDADRAADVGAPARRPARLHLPRRRHPLIWMRLGPTTSACSGLAAGACRSGERWPSSRSWSPTAVPRCGRMSAPVAHPRRASGTSRKLFQLSQIACFCPHAARRCLPVRVTLSVNGERHDARRVARRAGSPTCCATTSASSAPRSAAARARAAPAPCSSTAAPSTPACSTRPPPRATSWRRSRASPRDGLTPLQEAFVAEDAVQCGFCTLGADRRPRRRCCARTRRPAPTRCAAR